MICNAVDIAEVPVGERSDEIRRMLVERRRELLKEIQSRVRDVREVGSNSTSQPQTPAKPSKRSLRTMWCLPSFK